MRCTGASLRVSGFGFRVSGSAPGTPHFEPTTVASLPVSGFGFRVSGLRLGTWHLELETFIPTFSAQVGQLGIQISPQAEQGATWQSGVPRTSSAFLYSRCRNFLLTPISI